jgi:primosomal protein N' (replication factor Y) (superfamily II helicase)
MSSVYADVIVDITNEKLDRTFQYKVPPELTGEIGPGTAVQIPFGNGNRTITGYVLSVGNEPKYPQDRMKAILAVQKDAATVETKLIALAAWMRHTYGSTMIQALKTVLPGARTADFQHALLFHHVQRICRDFQFLAHNRPWKNRLGQQRV